MGERMPSQSTIRLIAWTLWNALGWMKAAAGDVDCVASAQLERAGERDSLFDVPAASQSSNKSAYCRGWEHEDTASGRVPAHPTRLQHAKASADRRGSCGPARTCLHR